MLFSSTCDALVGSGMRPPTSTRFVLLSFRCAHHVMQENYEAIVKAKKARTAAGGKGKLPKTQKKHKEKEKENEKENKAALPAAESADHDHELPPAEPAQTASPKSVLKPSSKVEQPAAPQVCVLSFVFSVGCSVHTCLQLDMEAVVSAVFAKIVPFLKPEQPAAEQLSHCSDRLSVERMPKPLQPSARSQAADELERPRKPVSRSDRQFADEEEERHLKPMQEPFEDGEQQQQKPTPTQLQQRSGQRTGDYTLLLEKRMKQLEHRRARDQVLADRDRRDDAIRAERAEQDYDFQYQQQRFVGHW